MSKSIDTTHGPVTGFIDTNRISDLSTAGSPKGKEVPIKKYLGIPYGQALRWTHAREPEPWTEPKECIEYGPACPQLPGLLTPKFIASSPSFYKRSHVGTSEEKMLTLNIYAPETTEEGYSRLPVMVWMYGGSWKDGAASGLLYDATEVVRDSGNVIVVTLNYRVNVFGFLASTDLQKSDKNGLTGNYGLRDQQLALKWVKENMDKFGGDESNITIYGESAGAASVAYHITGNAPLFKNAILQSGASGTMGLKSVKEHDTTWNLLLKHFGIEDEDPTTRVEKMRAVSTKELLDAMSKYPTLQWTACLESGPDAIWSVHPEQKMSKGEYINSLESVMLGCCKDEGTVFAEGMGLGKNPAILDKLLSQFEPDVQSKIKSLYQIGGPQTSTILHPISKLMADMLFDAPVLLLANHLVTKPNRISGLRAQVYVYLSECIIEPWKSFNWGVHHAADLPFAFNVNVLWKDGSEDDRSAKAFVKRWTAFAASGSPGEGWPRYSAASRKRLIIHSGGQEQVEDITEWRKDEMEVWFDVIRGKAGILPENLEQTDLFERRATAKV